MSLESFESSSTASGRIYQQARNSVNESRKNWREFEENPPPGSTGLTPAKIPLGPLKENSPHVGYTQGDRSPSSLSPPHSPRSRPPLARSVGSIETRNGVEMGRSVSPLQYSTRMSPPPSDQPTSTPVQPNHNPSPKQVHNHINSIRGVDSTPLSPPTSVPVLKLDHSNLSELEASTLEDRVKCNLFEIPTTNTTLDSLRKNSPTPAYSGYIPPEGMAHLCGGDDKDDYDHLSPVKLTSPSPSDHKPTSFDFTLFSRKPRSTSYSLPAENSGAQLFGDNDIDEALNELRDSCSSSRSSSAPQSPTDIFPHSRVTSLHRETEQQVETSSTAVQKGPNGLKPLNTIGQPQSQSQLMGYIRHSKEQSAKSPEGIPPPVPPKLRRQKSSSPPSNPDQSAQSNLSPSFYPSSISSHPHSKQSHPLPDFATDPVHVVQSSGLSQEEGCDDALSSVSNATLVPDPDPGNSSPTNVHSDHSTSPNTPRQGTKFNQNTEPFAGKRGGALNYLNPSSTRLPLSAHVHPELSLPPALSSLNHHSWKDSGNPSGTNFAPHLRPLPYESQGTCLPERQSVMTVSNSGSDSSLRGVSPPEKITHAVIQTRTHGNNHHPLKAAALVQSNSQPLAPVRPSSAQTQLSSYRTGALNQTYFQAPHCQNPPGEGNILNRNHRLYHSQRLTAVTRPRQRTLSGSKEGGSDNFLVGGSAGVRPPQQGNPRGVLKFQPVNSFETPLEEIIKMPPQPAHYQYHTKALSQDDQLMVGTFYHGGLAGGHGKSQFRGPKGTVHSYLADVDGYEGPKDGSRRSYGKNSYRTRNIFAAMKKYLHNFKHLFYIFLGPCALCHESIIGGLKIYGQLRYHSTCFKCSVCGE